ncbi:MAG: selenide, water dikinase SelD, partial [Proteobacteria bacterium]
ELRLGARVARAEPGGVVLDDGERVACDALVWAVGAASPPWLAASGLPTDARGFVRVRDTLAVVDHDALFAAGDCARFEPDLPKAGVYAVRQGPVLARNLEARVRGATLRRYAPQRDYFAALNLADGTAIGTKWGFALEGRPVFAFKDWIDRGFVRRFQVLGPDGAPTVAWPAMQPRAPMRCGGCAAKVGERALERALARLGVAHDADVELGLAAPDDAAVVRTSGGERIAASVDGFPAFTADPWLVGRVAAVHALGDLYAKGAAPRFALAQVAIAEDDAARAEEELFQVLAGARAALDADGVALVGGHTTAGDALHVGFAVWGPLPHAPLRLGALAPGDALILSKALGTGVLFAADALGRARGAWIEAAIASMLRSDAAAARVAHEVGARACTDVSGFGLAGHLGAMLRASKAGARLALDALPLLPGARECLGFGLRSSAHPENAKARGALRGAAAQTARPEADALFDPQTSGGLLFGVPAARARDALARLHDAGDAAAARIGDVVEPFAGGALVELVD